MRLDPALVERLTPRDYPNLVSTTVSDAAASIGDDLLRRAYLWASAIREAAARQGAGERHIVPEGLSFGFVEVPAEIDMPGEVPVAGGFTFGAQAIAAPHTLPHPELDFLYVGDRVFPLVLIPGDVVRHAAPAPPGRTGTCWAQGASPTKGGSPIASCAVLTASHMLTLSTVVPLQLPPTMGSGPGSGMVVASGEGLIDAAVIAIAPADWPAGVSPLAVPSAVAPGTPVEIRVNKSNPLSGQVLRVHQDRTYLGSLFGQRIFTDVHGNKTDSGSLVVTLAGDGIGIYLGETPDGTGGLDGICQDLYQVRAYYSLDLYD